MIRQLRARWPLALEAFDLDLRGCGCRGSQLGLRFGLRCILLQIGQLKLEDRATNAPDESIGRVVLAVGCRAMPSIKPVWIPGQSRRHGPRRTCAVAGHQEVPTHRSLCRRPEFLTIYVGTKTYSAAFVCAQT
jgi:hypothetical protein